MSKPLTKSEEFPPKKYYTRQKPETDTRVSILTVSIFVDVSGRMACFFLGVHDFCFDLRLFGGLFRPFYSVLVAVSFLTVFHFWPSVLLQEKTWP